jgi:hypothetical protein
VQNYILYYIAALVETKVADKQNSLKIGSPNSSVGMNPSTINLLGAILLSRTYAKNLSVRFVLATPIPMSIALWIWMHHGCIQKKPIGLGFPMQ